MAPWGRADTSDSTLFRALWTYLKPQAAVAVPMAVCLIAGAGLQLLGPQFLSRFIDTVAKDGASASLVRLWGLAGLFLAASLISQGVRLAGLWLSAKVGWGATNQLRHDLAAHCLSLDMAFHNATTPGGLIERIDGDVSALASFFSQFAVQIVASALLLIGILAVLTARDLMVGGALALFAAAALWTLNKTRHLGVDLFRAERQGRSELSGFIEERLGGLDDIRANGGGDHVMRGLDAHNAHINDVGERAIKVAQIYIVVVANAVFILGFGMALALGVWLFQHGRASMGSVFLLIQYTTMMREPLETIGAQVGDLQRVTASLGRVRELLALTPAVRGGEASRWTASPAAVSFDHVSFAYDDATPVLRDVSFELRAGGTLGLLGRTGSGKTTLARLLCRLYDPLRGEIRLDGRALRGAPLPALRGQIGVVTQDVQIFRASIRDNLTFFDPDVRDARLIQVLEDLGLGEWLARQPLGLDTPLSGGLSAGEAQLLAFARVFLRNPGIVILDEASSRLDPVTERLVERATDALFDGGGRRRTAIVIAHRLETVARLDEIMILEDGAVIEQGPRAALAAERSSRFAHLLRSGIEEVLA
jgi:ATP-binding cassette subfamily B protein